MMEWQNYGTFYLWNDEIIELMTVDWWIDGMRERFNDEFMESWNDGIMEWWNDRMMKWLIYGIIKYWNCGIMERWNDWML
jgi:hypothetical protein